MKFTILLATTSFFAVSAKSPTIRGGKKSDEERRLLEKYVKGPCTVENFNAQGYDVSSWPVSEFYEKCAEALRPTLDLSVAVGKGPQFLKNFLDGGTTWNDNYEQQDGKYKLSEDAAVIVELDDNAKTVVFTAPDGGTKEVYGPGYFSNFYNGDKECRMGAMTCCYTANREGNEEDNSEACAHDMSLSAKSNHIKSRAYTIFDTKSTDKTFCSGFAWEPNSFSDTVKYNTLAHMAMKENLYDSGRVKNIPGAPMCGCIEQMPIITNSSCIKAVEGYMIDMDDKSISLSLSWVPCKETNLLEHYATLEGRTDTETRFMKDKIVGEGNCKGAIKDFLNDKMLVNR